ncbi:capsid scaffolding protein [Pasteurellaceae bacterium Pebbles2]|nr:capsid scaffolding protein [Pasteurellaceae bacterium Pebbles2]
MTDKHKKLNWFVVATEGATTDGRAIQRSWIEQMATNYDPKKYGARINLEHIKFTLLWQNEPHSKCYGDITALKTQETEDGKLQLLAQIDPTEELIALNKDRQKIYTSIEVDTNFADSGEAYLVGLAVTDSPASLGTEMLKFAATANTNPFADRKQNPENVFTTAMETEFNFSESEAEKPSLFERIKNMFAKTERTTEERFADTDQAVLLLSEQVKEISEKYTALSQENAALTAKLAQMEQVHQDIQGKFAEVQNTPAPQFSERPKVVGSENNAIETDC